MRVVSAPECRRSSTRTVPSTSAPGDATSRARIPRSRPANSGGGACGGGKRIKLHSAPGMSWVDDLSGGEPSCVPSAQPAPTPAMLGFDGVNAALAPPAPLTADEVEAHSNPQGRFNDAADAEAKAARLKARGENELAVHQRAVREYANDVDTAVDELRDELAARGPKRERAPQGEKAATVSRHAPFGEWAAQLGPGQALPPSQKELAAAKAAAARRRAAKMLERQNKAAEKRKAEERELANKKETRAEREKREKKEREVQMKLFKMDQIDAAHRLMSLWRPMVLLNAIVITTTGLNLVYIFPARTARTEVAGKDENGELLYYDARPWRSFWGVMWGMLSAFGSLLSLVNILQVRCWLVLQGTHFNAGIAKISIYMGYFSVWCQFQALVSHCNKLEGLLARISADVEVAAKVTDADVSDVLPGTVTVDYQAASVVCLVLAILVIPTQLAIQFFSYSVMYRGLAPLVGAKQMETHFRLCVQLALVSNSIFLAVFMGIYLNFLVGIETDTIYASLYQVAFAFNGIGVAVQILYKRINTFTDTCNKEREQLKAAQLALEDTLEVDVAKDAVCRIHDLTKKSERILNECVCTVVDRVEVDHASNPDAQPKVKVRIEETTPKNFVPRPGKEEYKPPKDLVGTEVEVAIANLETDESDEAHEARVKKVELEQAALELDLLDDEAHLDRMHYYYVVVCQFTVCGIILYITVLYNLDMPAGINLYDDMEDQIAVEVAFALGEAPCPDGQTCTVIQLKTCALWKRCGESISMFTEECGFGMCAIPDGPCEDNEICVAEEVGWNEVGGTCIAIGVVCGLIGVGGMVAIFRCIGTTIGRSLCMGFILGSFVGLFSAVFAYYTIAIDGEITFPCDDFRFGRELGRDCLERQAASWVKDTFISNASGAIMGSLLGLTFYLVQSFILLAAVLQRRDANGFAAFQMTIQFVYQLLSMGLWPLISLVLYPSGLFDSFDEWDKKIANKEAEMIRLHSANFPLVEDSYIDGMMWQNLSQAQDEIAFLWLDPPYIFAAVVAISSVQIAGLLIVYVAGEKYLPMLKWVLLGEIIVSAYIVVLIRQLNLCVSPLGIVLTVVFSPSLLLLLVSSFYVVQSDILGAITKSRPAMALTVLSLATLYMLAVGISYVIAASYAPDVLAAQEADGYLLVTIGGIVVLLAFVAGVLILLRMCITWCRQTC